MNISCVICTELFTPSSNVFHTPCGHLFHYACLNQWLERSQTCPQCRGGTQLNNIHRVYFNFVDNDTVKEDEYLMQNKIDRLRMELITKDRDAKRLSKKCGTLENKTKNLKKKLEEMDVVTKKKIHNFKMEADFAMIIVDNFRKENDQLKAPFEACKKFTDDIFVYNISITNPTHPINLPATPISVCFPLIFEC